MLAKLVFDALVVNNVAAVQGSYLAKTCADTQGEAKATISGSVPFKIMSESFGL